MAIDFIKKIWKDRRDPTLVPGTDPEMEAAEFNRFENVLQALVDAVNAGGIGGGGIPPASQTLFIQQTIPSVGAATKNTLWIPTNVDGTIKDMSLWQWYTGFASGDGGNLIISRDEPNPTVDALWVPLDNTDKPKFIDEWKPKTGRGSAPPGSGNPNLFISPTEPVAPPIGSMWIPLNSDDTAKTMDFWKFYTDP